MRKETVNLENFDDPDFERMENWRVAFEASPFFAHLTEEQKQESPFVIEVFGDCASFADIAPGEWDAEDLDEICLDILPEDVPEPPEFFRAVTPVLSAFFAFLERQGTLPQGPALREKLGRIDAEMQADAADPDVWTEYKSVHMMAYAAGVDLGDPAQYERFAAEYNKALGRPADAPLFTDDDEEFDGETELSETGEPILREGPKVGRNDPCPCGSGKKYKKCHGSGH